MTTLVIAEHDNNQLKPATLNTVTAAVKSKFFMRRKSNRPDIPGVNLRLGFSGSYSRVSQKPGFRGTKTCGHVAANGTSVKKRL